MGTLIRISVYSAKDPTEAMLGAKLRFEELDARLSHYKPDSEINRLQPGLTTKVSSDLFAILTFAQRLSLLSGGAFDVTVRGNPAGYQNIALGRHTVTLLKEGMLLDLGGIAKGYANDQASKLLAARGIRRHLIAASGDVLARGKPGWRVGFQQTERVLEDRAVSTSGNSYQPGHILDPRSGQRVMSSETVSVVARDSMTADALATTCLILKGAERAALLAAYAGAEVVSA